MNYKIIEVEMPPKKRRIKGVDYHEIVTAFIESGYDCAEVIIYAENYNNLRRGFQRVCDINYPDVSVSIRGNRIFLSWNKNSANDRWAMICFE